MGGGGITALKAYREQIPDAEDLGGLEVNSTEVPEGRVVHIDGKTGQVAYEQGDGSLMVNAPAIRPERDGTVDFDENLADDPEVPLGAIASRLLEGIEADLKSRQEWEETGNRGREMLGVHLEDPTTNVSDEGTVSQARNTALLEAVVRSWANSRAELLPAAGPVKVEDDRPLIEQQQGTQPNQPEGQPSIEAAQMTGQGAKNVTRSDMADALQKDMNHFLTNVDRDYYPSFSQMLLNRAINGVQFRKIYFDPLLRRPTSAWVKGEDLIVSNDTSHLSGAGRVTERIPTRQSIAKRLMTMKHWRRVNLTMPAGSPTPTERTVGEIEGQRPIPDLPQDQRHTIYECYTELEDGPLANDETGKEVGFPLPYRVTIDKDSQEVLEIRRNWKPGDEDYRARRRYVKYGFVPGLGFYDWGLVHLLGNPQRATTAIQRILIDSGMFSSFPGGLMQKGPGTRQRTNEVRVGPGQFQVIDTGGLPIKDFASPFPYNPPSEVLAGIGSSISGDMRRLAGVLEMPIGEGRVGNVPVGTMMSYVDSITKVPSAIHKDDHTAQSEEFQLLKELFAENPDTLTKGVKRPARSKYTTQELLDQDLVAAADPNIPSQTHRLMIGAALAEAGGMPLFQGIANGRAIWASICKSLGQDPEEMTVPPQPVQAPPPDPRIAAATIKSEGDKAKAAADVQKTQSTNELKATELSLKQQEAADDRASEERRAGMKLQGDALKAKTSLATNAADNAQNHAQHLNELGEQRRQHGIDVAADLAKPPNGSTNGSSTE